MNRTGKYLLVFAMFFLNMTIVSCQLVVDAGTDTLMCNANNYILGGTPTASGGTPPYTYKWSTSYIFEDITYYASDILDDTTVANPKLLAIADSLTLYLEVIDANEYLSRDTVKIAHSGFSICLVLYEYSIVEGDSVRLEHCIEGGIPPLTYTWFPNGTVSNPYIPDPWAKPDTNTKYDLIIVDSIGCTASTYCFVNVIPASDVQMLSSALEFNIYPNPGNTRVFIETSHITNQAAIFELFNTGGRKEKSIELNHNITALDIDDLPPGLYLYKIHYADITQSGKYVINSF